MPWIRNTGITDADDLTTAECWVTEVGRGFFIKQKQALLLGRLHNVLSGDGDAVWRTACAYDSSTLAAVMSAV